MASPFPTAMSVPLTFLLLTLLALPGVLPLLGGHAGGGSTGARR